MTEVIKHSYSHGCQMELLTMEQVRPAHLVGSTQQKTSSKEGRAWCPKYKGTSRRLAAVPDGGTRHWKFLG